jgi:hypothetical protein
VLKRFTLAQRDLVVTEDRSSAPQRITPKLQRKSREMNTTAF